MKYIKVENAAQLLARLIRFPLNTQQRRMAVDFNHTMGAVFDR